jgi:hypothetical protein
MPDFIQKLEILILSYLSFIYLLLLRIFFSFLFHLKKKNKLRENIQNKFLSYVTLEHKKEFVLLGK